MSPLPILIQGGMGVAISSWKLARTVAELGHLGVVSGVGVGYVLAQRLSRGDELALATLRTFPDASAAREIEEKYFVPAGGQRPERPHLPEMWSIEPTHRQERLVAVGAFVEVTLAKQGHHNAIGMNLLEKAVLPNLATIYGAMLASVDVVLMGAGIPLRIPGVLDALSRHEGTSYAVMVEGADKSDDFRVHFDPRKAFPDMPRDRLLLRPRFYPVVSSHVLAQALLKRADGRIDGFIVEAPTAGGHNAPPRGAMELTAAGEPVYGPRDAVDFGKMKELGLPFWLAGGVGSPEGLQRALAAGAVGVQVGTAFAYCRESGMEPGLRRRILGEVRSGGAPVKTDPRASPTGFPFKVVQMDGTVSDDDVMNARPRVCNIGVLRGMYKRDDGSVGYRCPAEPEQQWASKGGKPEDTGGRVCLCNGLLSTAGMALPMKTGALEPPLVTAGDDLSEVARFLRDGEDDYGAADVILQLVGHQAVGHQAVGRDVVGLVGDQAPGGKKICSGVETRAAQLRES